MRRLFAATKLFSLYLSLLGAVPFFVSIHQAYHPMLPLKVLRYLNWELNAKP